MYKVKIISNFSAAHSLRGYQGKCENLHGHNWKVEVSVSSDKLDSCGMVIDFSELKKITGKILDELDHKHLNELPYFTQNNPSSENIACHIFNKLKAELKGRDFKLEEVSVWETDNSCASHKETL